MLRTSFANGSRAYLVIPLALLFVCARPAAGGEDELIVESAQIKKTKANGKAWDAANGLPDPYVIVFVQSSGAKKRKQSARPPCIRTPTARAGARRCLG